MKVILLGFAPALLCRAASTEVLESTVGITHDASADRRTGHFPLARHHRRGGKHCGVRTKPQARRTLRVDVFVDEIRLDGRLWQTANDFYTAYLTAVGAPNWHGRNLDALWDSLTGGDFNLRNPPFRGDARQMVERFVAVIEDARAEGHVVEVDLES